MARVAVEAPAAVADHAVADAPAQAAPPALAATTTTTMTVRTSHGQPDDGGGDVTAQPSTEAPAVYLVPTARWRNASGEYGGYDYQMIALAADGEVLGQHICSSPQWALHDLHNRAGMHGVYERKFGQWGDGGQYRIVQVEHWDMLPKPVRDAADTWAAINADATEVDA